jgi:hypothetical protein
VRLIDDGKSKECSHYSRIFNTSTKNETDEKMLLSSILNERELIEISKIYSNKILKNIPYFIQIQRFSRKWNIIPSFKKALELESKRMASGMKKPLFLEQIAMFTVPPSEISLLAWEFLDLKQVQFKAMLNEYIKIANTQESNADAAFKVKEISPEDAIRTLLKGEKPRLADKRKPGYARKVKQKTTFERMKLWFKKDLEKIFH